MKRSQLILLAIFIIAVYVIVPQLGDFRGSLGVLRHLDWGYVVLALLFFFATYAAAAGTYLFLSFKRLSYGQTVKIQMASMFMSRLLPAGLGSLGANYLYLRHTKQSVPESAAVLTVNNLLGFVGHGLIVLIVLLAWPHSRTMVRTPQLHIGHAEVVIAGISILVIVAVVLWRFRRRVHKALQGVGTQLYRYKKRPGRLVSALATSIVLTSCNMLCLYFCAMAVGIQVTLLAAVLIFSLGIGLGTSTPTPGGIGGTEAGIVAGFLAYGAHSQTSLAAVLLFRLISYWLALALGAIAFIDCRRQNLFTVKY